MEEIPPHRAVMVVLGCKKKEKEKENRYINMAAFSSNEARCMEQILEVNSQRRSKSLEESCEINKCVQWIVKHGFRKVCLQFPDNLLSDSTEVLLAVQERVSCQLFLMGDSTYGSCCVDEVSAGHVEGDAIIHFGHACLSPTKRLPVLYIFPTLEINQEQFISHFKKEYIEPTRKIQLIFDIAYEHASASIYDQLSKVYFRLKVAKLVFADDLVENDEIVRLGRRINLSNGENITDYSFVFVGEDNRTFSNFLLELPRSEFYIYNPSKAEDGIRHVGHHDSKFLMKRMYLVERVKDASTVGVLIGTLGVANYLEAVEHVRKLAAACGKRVYVIAVGRPNVPKLANFPEIDVFVHVACPESTLLDSHEFYKPIVSMYELELACNPNRFSQMEFVADFRRLVQDCEIVKNDELGADVSLVTGKVRSLATDDEQLTACGGSALVQRPDLVVSVGAGGDFLAKRSWRGLEPNLGETPVELAVEGRSGIAAGYDTEPR